MEEEREAKPKVGRWRINGEDRGAAATIHKKLT